MGCRCSGETNQISEHNREKDLTVNPKIDTINTNAIPTPPPLINSSFPVHIHDNQVSSSTLYPKTAIISKQDTINMKSSLQKSISDNKFGNFKHYCQDNNNINSHLNQIDSSAFKIHSLNYSLLNELNAIRTNPKSYILKLAKHLNNIIVKENKCLLNIGNDVYISLQTGYTAFENAIAFLSSAKSVDPLEYANELKIDFDIEEDKLTEPQGESITSLEFIKSALMKKTNQVKEMFDIVGFHYDKSTDNAEVSAMLQIVDDTGSNYVRRNNIMDSKVKFVGINSCCVRENVFCFYLVFANRKKEST